MSENKKGLMISGGLFLIAILYTILIKYVDVQAIGPENSAVGFATINGFVSNLIGVNMIWYTITDWLGLILLVIVAGYGVTGLVQLIKRKSLFKVDKEIIALGVFYVIIACVYILFEVLIINYRPTLMEGLLEASYPSSHTLLAICVCGSSLLINKYLFKENKLAKFENIISIVALIVIVVGRIISGVHWLTDIVGAIIISAALLNTLNLYLKKCKKDKEKK